MARVERGRSNQAGSIRYSRNSDFESDTPLRRGAPVNLIGKSRADIEQALESKQRWELLDIIFSLAAMEPHFSVTEVARARKLSRDTILAKIRKREIPRVHRPVENALRIPLSSIHEWDRNTKVT
jgi:predicted DNA-binding transcriptional regulator AlpA